MDVMEKASSKKRLIDADRAMEIVRNQGIAHPNAYYLTNYAMLVLQEAPTVDAVEVVRCKDCKHQCKIWHADKRMKEKGYWIYSCKRNSDPFVSHTVNGYDDEYCCYGERKKGENDE